MGINVGTAEGYFDIDITSLKTAAASAVKALEKLERQDALVESGIAKLEDVVRSAAGGFTNTEQKVKSLSAQIDSSKKKINIYEEGITSLNEIIQRSGKEQENLSKKIKAVSNKYQESEKQVKALKSAYTDAKKVLKEVTDAHGKESEQAKSAAESVDTAKKAYENAADKSGAYRNELLQLEARHEALGRQIAGSKEKVDEFSTKINITKTDIAKLTAELTIAESRAINFGKKAEEVGDKWVKAGDKIGKVGNGLTLGVTAPILAAGYGSFKAASNFESAWTGVTKTVDGTEHQLSKLRSGIIDMSQELPTSTTEISSVAEAAGQLGIQTDNVLGFTKTIIDLGNSTNLAGEEGASSLARFANITEMSQNNFDRLGASIVDLGNNFATTEAEIVDMGMRIAGAGHQVGLSEGSIMGIATALSSVGINAEMGGSAFSKAMVRMQVAVETGLGPVNNLTKKTGMSLRDLQLMSENSSKDFAELAGELGMTKTELQNIVDSGVDLQNFADIAGVSSEKFAAAFKNNAVEAIQMFIHGLGDTENAGESTIKMLQDMGFSETRLRDTMTRLANSGDLVTRAVETGNKAWDENTALVNEANKRYATTDSKLKIAKNTLSEAGRTVGEELLPVVADVAKDIANAAKAFSKLDPETKKTIVKFSALAAATGPLIKGVGGTVKGVGTLTKGIGSLLKGLGKKSAIEGAAAAVGKMGSTATAASGGLAAAGGSVGTLVTSLGAIALPASAAIAVIGGITYASWKMSESYRETQKEIDRLKDKLNESEESWNKVKDATDESSASADIEMDRVQSLWDELQKLVDTNGKIKDGYEARVDYINGELNEALGTEITRNGDVVESYEKVADQIDELIAKQRAARMISAYDDEYDEAFKQRTQLIKDQEETQKKFLEQQSEVNDKQKVYNNLISKLAEDPYNKELSRSASAVYLELTNAKKQLKELENIYSNREKIIRDANNTIQKVERANEEFIAGNYEKVEKTLTRYSDAYKTATDATKEELLEQAANASAHMIELRKRFNEGADNITEDMVNEAEDLAYRATKEYQYAGGQAGDGYIVGLSNKGEPIYQTAYSLGKSGLTGMQSGFTSNDLTPPSVRPIVTYEAAKKGRDDAQEYFNSHPVEIRMKADEKLKDALAKGVPYANAYFEYNLNISKRAVGGVFHHPEIIEVGEAGPEAVVPLKDNAPWIDGLALSLSRRMVADVSQDVARQLVAQKFMTQPRREALSGIDYDLLAQRLADTLRESPIMVSANLKNNVDVKVNMDSEAVGKATAPTVSRIIARNSR